MTEKISRYTRIYNVLSSPAKAIKDTLKSLVSRTYDLSQRLGGNIEKRMSGADKLVITLTTSATIKENSTGKQHPLLQSGNCVIITYKRALIFKTKSASAW